MQKINFRSATYECCLRLKGLLNHPSVRGYPLTHIALNILTDPSVLSGSAATIYAWGLNGGLGNAVRGLNISAVIVYAILRGIAEYYKIKNKRDIAEYLRKMEGSAFPPYLSKIVVAEKPSGLFSLYSKILGLRFVKKVKLRPQLFAQLMFQMSVAALTAIPAWQQSSSHLFAVLAPFALNACSNILFILNDNPVGKKSSDWENKSIFGKTADIARSMFFNPYLPGALAFLFFGGAQLGKFLSELSYAMYASAVFHSVVVAHPAYLKWLSTKERDKVPGWLDPVQKLAQREDSSALLLSAGCLLAMGQAMWSGAAGTTAVMGLSCMTGLGVYSLLRWGGVSEAIDACTASREKSERPQVVVPGVVKPEPFKPA